MKTTTCPEYLKTDKPGHEDVCYGCDEAAKQRPDTDRWYVTMGHPGFNSPANNGRGYATRGAALAAVRFYGSRRPGRTAGMGPSAIALSRHGLYWSERLHRFVTIPGEG